MGGSISGAATRGCRGATHTLIAAALAVAVLALFAGTAAAQPATTAVITSAPLATTQHASPSFAFEALGGSDTTLFECRLDGASRRLRLERLDGELRRA